MEKVLKSSGDKIHDIRCVSKYAHKLAEIVDNRYVEIVCKSCGFKVTIDMKEYNRN